MRARSQRRSFADSPVRSMAPAAIVPQPQSCISSGAHGWEGVMTRARRRRLLAESIEPLETNTEAHFQDPSAGLLDWRDWANLAPDIVGEIGGRLLALDVAEYLRLRAVCKPWRDHTDDPRSQGALDSRFRPRNWVVLTITPDARARRRRLLNLATAASIGVDLPALTTHCHLCAADGLLVLFDRSTKAIRLLDPLSNSLTEFPAISSIVATVPPFRRNHVSAVFRDPCGVNTRYVNGAGFDDSTSPPTLLLCLRCSFSNIIFAKPGDAYWTLVDQGDAYHSVYHPHGRVLFHSLLSIGGCCYVCSPEGSVYLVELRPLPRLAVIIDQRQGVNTDAIVYLRILSFLFHGGDGRMLMVRYWINVEHFGGREAFNPMELFTAGGKTRRFEVLEVDLARRRFVPVKSLGCHAVFIGMTHCVLVSAKTFPSIAASAIYLGFYYQPNHKFSIYHLNSRRTEPPHELSCDRDMRVFPRARPCNLDQYLACYVDRMHEFSGSCINHVGHYLLGKFG